MTPDPSAELLALGAALERGAASDLAARRRRHAKRLVASLAAVAVLAIGLAKDPRDRFAFALELARWFSAAVTTGLDPDQRRRADELIDRYPWGTRPGVSTG